MTDAAVRVRAPRLRINRMWWLVIPALALFGLFFVAPLVSLLSISFNPPAPGSLRFEPTLTFQNFIKFFTNDLYYGSVYSSLGLAGATTAITIVLGYPLAFLVARTKKPGRNTFYLILILGAMQLDIIVRMFGMMVLLGDNGMINDLLRALGLVKDKIPLMYNKSGVITGLVQATLPLMVLPLIGVIRSIDISLEEAARSLGAGRWSTFWKVTVPLSVPGILAGSILVFGVSISSYAVPSIMGGGRVFTMSTHMYQQIMFQGAWQFGASIGVVLFVISLALIYIYHRASQRQIGGLI